MSKRTIGLGRLSAIVLLATMALSRPMRAEDGGEGWSVTPLLPPDTLFVVSVNDAQKSIEKLKQTGLWQIYNSPEMQQAFRTPLMQAQFFIGMAELQLGEKLTDIVSLFTQGEITFALLGADKRGPNGQPLPDMLLSIQARGKAGAMAQELNKRLDQLKAAANNIIRVQQIPVGDVVANKLTVPAPEMPGGEVSISYALTGGNLVITFGEGRLERLLAMREKYKAAAPKPGDAAEVLAQTPSYSKVREKAGDSDLVVFANVEAILKNPILDARPKNEQQRIAFDASGVAGIRAIAFSSTVKDKGIRELFYVDVPADARKGVLGLADGEPLSPEVLAAAPKNSLFAGAVRISAEKLLDRVMELAVLENPNAKEELNAGLLAVNQQLNLDVKKELLKALTGQGLFSVSVTPRHPKLPVGFPTPLVTLGIQDQASLKNILKAVRSAARDSFEFTETIVGDKEIVSAREKFPEGREPFQMCYVIDKNDLILSIFPLALREELKRREQATAGGSLMDDPDFKAARGALISSPQAIFYMDTGALAVAAYDVAIPIAQLRERRPEVDFAAMPSSEVLLKNIVGTVFSFSTDKDGIIAEGYSPTGGIAFAFVAPVLARVGQMAQRRVEVQVNKTGKVMEQVAADLRAYAAENNGNYPATLKEMQPKYLNGLDAELGNVVYRGKQDAPNKVVAHSSEKIRGPITIITQDGNVAQVARPMLGKVLQEGFSQKAAITPAQGGADPVKPPRPPEF